jgi:hypothetical protein
MDWSTLVGGLVRLVQEGVDDVMDVGRERVAGAEVHILLCDLSERHTRALQCKMRDGRKNKRERESNQTQTTGTKHTEQTAVKWRHRDVADLKDVETLAHVAGTETQDRLHSLIVDLHAAHASQ